MRASAFAAIVMIAACSPVPVNGNSAEVASNAAAPVAVRLALLPPSREGDAALTIGRLAVEGPCLYLVREGEARTMPAFITFDTRWDDGTLVVGKQRFSVGQRVKLGGGEVNGAVANMAWTQAPDPSCDTSKLWVTVSVDPA